MFRDTYKSYNERIVPSNELIADTVIKVSSVNTKNTLHINRRYKKILVAAALIVFVSVIATLPTFAVQFDPIYELMYYFSPRFAQLYSPVNESSTSNDVKMDVLACYVHEDTIEIYVTMQDLTGERFSGGVDLNDSYSVNVPYDCSSNCRLVSYDDNTKTAGFLITVSQWGDKDIVGDKVTFTVNDIITDKKVYSMNIPIDLREVSIVGNTQKVYVNSENLAEEDYYTDVLVSTAPYEEFLVDGVDLTGIGYVDGKLHIQYRVKDYLENDNHGKFYFIKTVDDVSDTIFAEKNYRFTDNNIAYFESVFDISKEQLGNSKLYCEFFSTGENIEGKWKVTFSIENKGDYLPTEEDEVCLSYDIDLSDIKFMNIGAELPELLYADEETVIIHGACGVIVYDLNERMIVNRISDDYLKQRGIFCAKACTSIDGRDIYITDADEMMHSSSNEISIYKYNVILRTLSQRKGLLEDVFPKQQFGFSEKDKNYIDENKLTGSISVRRDNDFIFLQADKNWNMNSLQIVICDFNTGKKEIIDVFE